MESIVSSTSASPNRPVIVGSGIAGLTAALYLAKAGLSPIVLEANPNMNGGRLASGPPVEFTFKGQTWSFHGEHGVHGFWSQYRNLRHLLQNNGIYPHFIPAQRQEWIYRDGSRIKRAEMGQVLRDSWIPAPFHYLALFANPRFLAMFSPWDILRLPIVGGTLLTALGIDPMTEGEYLEGLNVADFLWGWPKVLKDFVVALGRSGLSADPAEVPLGGFVAFLRFYTLLRRDAGAFEYLREDGGTAIVAPLVDAIASNGGQVVNGIKVMSIEREVEDCWRILWEHAADGDGVDTDGRGGSITTRHVILAADAPGTKAILYSGDGTKETASDLRWPSAQKTVIVRLWFAMSPRVRAESGLMGGSSTVDNFFWLHLLQEDFSRWHESTGGSAVEAHIYSPQELLEQPDSALLALAVDDFARVYPELRGHLVQAAIHRNPPTHTLFSVGTTLSHLGVRTPWPGIFCCGDWVRHETPALFMERSCITGLEAANDILAARGMPVYPVLPLAGPEPLARGLEILYRLAFRVIRRLVNKNYPKPV